MSELISLVAANKNLLYVDPVTNQACSFNELFQTTEIINSQEKKIAFLYLDNSVNSIAAFWNFFRSNHVLALLSSALKPDFKQALEALYKPAFIFDPVRATVENYSAEKFNSSCSIFCRKDNESYKIDSQLKLLLTTSGTTGSPKFVKLSEKNLLCNAQSILGYLPIRKEDVTPLNLPVHYSYGLSVFITNSMAGGTIICTTKDILQKDFWNDFEKYKCTSLAGVPYVYEVLYRTGFTKKSFPSLRYFTQAGGKLNEQLTDAFIEFSKNNNSLFYIMYGQTEATARMSYLAPEYLRTKKLSIGKPVLNGRFELDAATHELLYFGENVFGGYADSLRDLETFASVLPLRTGDVADVDADGFYFITGRLKRIVKLFGNRINLDEIEKTLNEQFRESSFICTGVDDQVLLIGAKNFGGEEKTISMFLNSRFAIHPSVIRVKHVDQIPLTDNSKINYAKFIEQHGN